MTVYVKTFNGKTISIKCGRRQEATKIEGEVGRNTKMHNSVSCVKEKL